MARGNQRDKAREKNMKDSAGQVRGPSQYLHSRRMSPLGIMSTFSSSTD